MANFDWRMKDTCVYCGSYADTRDHVPSKCFLDEPYPDNLLVVPCCSKCNNIFSKDEEYVSSIIDCIKDNTTDPSKLSRKRASKTLLHSEKLLKRIQNQKCTFADIVAWDIERNRFEQVIRKLAYGHLAYENNTISLMSEYTIHVMEINRMPDEQRRIFEKPYLGNISPEVGCNALLKEGCFSVIEGEYDSFFCNQWVPIQKGRYRYCVSPDSTMVKFVIAEFLAIEVCIV